jgi:hypothetical protein
VTVPRSAARICAKRDDSNLSRITTFEFRQRFGRELVEATLRSVTLDLPIPSLPVVLDEPLAERCQLFGSQPFNFTLESFKLRHINVQVYGTADVFRTPPRTLNCREDGEQEAACRLKGLISDCPTHTMSA